MNDIAQARAIDVFEDEERPPVAERAMIERAHDVTMIESLDRVELALEPGQRIVRANQLEMKNLDRDETAIVLARRAPYLTEPTFADQTIDAITINDGGKDGRGHERVHHASRLGSPVSTVAHSASTIIVRQLARSRDMHRSALR